MSDQKPEALRVFFSKRDNECIECGENLEKGEKIALDSGNKVICLTCADLDHLVYLKAGNATLTGRAKKHSKLWALVFKYSPARKRSERQGILVERRALERAEVECAKDENERKIKRALAAKRREKLDREYVAQFADKIRELFPNCPTGRETEIAEHACEKYSGRVGRTSEAKRLDEGTVRIAVIAHIRHNETVYDKLLMEGYDRFYAREVIASKIDRLLNKWESGS